MLPLKQYTFIKPVSLTPEESYIFMQENHDLYGQVLKTSSLDEILRHLQSFYGIIGITLTYNMIKYKTTLKDFTYDINDDNTKITGIISDDEVEYRKRRYRINRAVDVSPGEPVLFIKHVSDWGYYITCTDSVEIAENKQTIKHISKS